MKLTRPIFILFGLNLVDAILTIVWVQTGIATETNQFMDALLSMGVLPFFLFKIGMGAFTAGVLIYGSNFRLARYGVTAALAAYSVCMCTHILTGLAAYGYFS